MFQGILLNLEKNSVSPRREFVLVEVFKFAGFQSSTLQQFAMENEYVFDGLLFHRCSRVIVQFAKY